MKLRHSFFLIAVLLACVAVMTPPTAGAQTTGQSTSASTPPSSEPTEKKFGEYTVQQSIEFGYRFVDVSSTKLNPAFPTNVLMYNTLVNEQEGPRLLEQTFSMRAPGHNGVLFDNLYVNSFGWGGDPENVGRIRADKHKWYNFNASFRRDKNFWDYDVLANPLNPFNSPVIITFSPHRFETTRRMYDFNLTLAPQSRVSLRLGYNRNVNEGPSYSTFHEGTDVLLLQDFRATNNGYQIGVDFKPFARTNISYDQFLQWYKGDTSWVDQTFPWVLPAANGGKPADLGLPFSSVGRYPCATPFSPAAPIANPACNVYLAYNRQNPYRTSIPTEQLSFQSNYFHSLDITGRVMYSDATMTAPFGFNDFFNGLVTRTSVVQFTDKGPQNADRIAVATDFGITVHVTDRFRISDSFRFNRFSTPGIFTQTTNDWTGTLAGTVVGPVPTTTDTVIFTQFLGENTKTNLVQAEYDFSKYFGGHIGYRFRHRLVTKRDAEIDVTGGTADSGEDSFDITEHGGVVGVWFRPTQSFRANVDADFTSADNFITRISPRNQQQYRARLTYNARRNVVVSATGNVWTGRNGLADIRYRGHNRNYGLYTTYYPSDKFAFDFSYNYNNIASNAFICFLSSSLPAGTTACSGLNAGSSAVSRVYQVFVNRVHYGSATVMFKPVKRLAVNMGYSIVSSDGAETLLNPLSPYGSLFSNFHRPVAGLEFQLGGGVSAKAGYNYYGYNEKTPLFGSTAPRDFHSNNTTLSLRYAF